MRWQFASSAAKTPTGAASNPGLVVVDANGRPSPVLATVLGSGTSHTLGPNFTPFSGNCPNITTVTPNITGLSGPNGVIVVEKRRHADVWAGDGPMFNTQCNPTSGIKRYSQLVVFDLFTGALKKTISTGGIRRADELCYNPVSDVVLVANNTTDDNFITFVGGDSPYPVLQKISFKASPADPNAGHVVANGIEQCQFNPRDGKFYLNIPATVEALTVQSRGF